MKLLKSIPGIGCLSAIEILVELQDITRFKTAKEHLKDLVTEDLFQMLCLKTRCYSEHPVSIETSVCTQNV